jgi:bilirubin oxidase
VENGLPIDTTVQWHGLPVPADQDGNPMDPVRPDAVGVCEFELPWGQRAHTGTTRTRTA